MNAHFFGTKRAFHSILRITRKPLAWFGLTAARYDMLYAIGGRAPEANSSPIDQSELAGRLGVHKSVVSRMLRSLEELGFVTRERNHYDRRRFRVEVTEAGAARMRDAIACLARAFQRLLWMTFCSRRWRDLDVRFHHLNTYEGYLYAIRIQYGDRAWLGYPWHPDD